jgi:hypothetical protein
MPFNPGTNRARRKAYFTEGALVKPIDKLTGSDFFPDVYRGERASCVWPFYLLRPAFMLT